MRKNLFLSSEREREREKSWLNVSRAVFVIGNSILIFHLSRAQRRSWRDSSSPSLKTFPLPLSLSLRVRVYLNAHSRESNSLYLRRTWFKVSKLWTSPRTYSRVLIRFDHATVHPAIVNPIPLEFQSMSKLFFFSSQRSFSSIFHFDTADLEISIRTLGVPRRQRHLNEIILS